MPQTTEISAGLLGHLARMQTFTLPCSPCSPLLTAYSTTQAKICVCSLAQKSQKTRIESQVTFWVLVFESMLSLNEWKKKIVLYFSPALRHSASRPFLSLLPYRSRALISPCPPSPHTELVFPKKGFQGYPLKIFVGTRKGFLWYYLTHNAVLFVVGWTLSLLYNHPLPKQHLSVVLSILRHRAAITSNSKYRKKIMIH